MKGQWDWFFDLVLLPVVIFGAGYEIAKAISAKPTTTVPIQRKSS